MVHYWDPKAEVNSISQTSGVSAVCSANALKDNISPTERTGSQEMKRGRQSWLTGHNLLLFVSLFILFKEEPNIYA